MKITRSRIIEIAVVLIVLSYPIISEVVYYRSISPAGGVRFADFEDKVSRYSPVHVFLSSDRELLKFRGLLPKRGILAHPSAAPNYYFDRSGNFVGWVRDPGDMSTPQRLLPTGDEKLISFEEARSMLTTQK